MGILEQVIEILGQIIGFFFAYHLLRLAYKLLAKGRFAGAVFASWAAAFVLLCSLPWFEVWAKSFITSNITSQLTAFSHQVGALESATQEMHGQLAGCQSENDLNRQALGEVQSNLWSIATNVNTLQAAAAEMRNQLAGQQATLDQHREELDKTQGSLWEAETNYLGQRLVLTNELDQIFLLQSELAGTSANISETGKRISESEKMVRNVYALVTNQPPRMQDINVLR